MYKLGLEKTEEQDIKLPLDHRKSKGIPEKHLLLLTVWITINWKILKEMGIPDHCDLPLEKSICRSGSNSYNWTWNNRLVTNRKRSPSRLYIVTLLI